MQTENEKEFFRSLTTPSHNPKAGRNLDRYLDIVRKLRRIRRTRNSTR
jgi:hypothetical protein